MSEVLYSPDFIVARECRHATYTTDREKKNDCLTVKEWLYLKDGRRVPNVTTIENYQRPFWVTKKACRTHKDWIEWDKKEHLEEYRSTQVDLVDNVARATKQFGGRQTLRGLANSPYVYGYDVSPTVLVKAAYKKRWPDHVNPVSQVACLDIESDVVNGNGDIILITLSYKDRVFLGINKGFLQDTTYNRERLLRRYMELLGKYNEERNINLVVEWFDNEGDLAAGTIGKAHEWKPDIISVWNINYDLPKIIEALKKYKYDLNEVFSDPAVPDRYKYFKYNEGKTQKVTQSGKVSGLHPADRWHEVICPASFYFLDAMCVYKRIRAAAGMVSDYSLDGALNRHLSLSKLKFEATDHLSKLAWHIEMQKNFKFEYAIYNIFDCIGLELLDEKIGDLGRSFSALVGVSDFNNFDSNPRRIADDLHYFCLERGLVIATTGDNLKSDLDKYVVDMKGWINYTTLNVNAYSMY